MFIAHKIILDKLLPPEITDHISSYVEYNDAMIDLQLAIRLSYHSKTRSKLLRSLKTCVYTFNDLVVEFNKISNNHEIERCPANKLVMFRLLYKHPGKYYKFINSNIPEGVLEGDIYVQSREGSSKLLAESVCAWNYMKQNHWDIMVEYEKIYLKWRQIFR